MALVKHWGVMVAAALMSGSASASDLTFFTDYTPLSGNAEIARRMMSPLGAADLARALERAHRRLGEQPVDLADEHFLLHVPPEKPPQGYGVLVFIAPAQEAVLPQGWASVLDKFGIILVSAARSGNAENTVTRRVPLALLAEHNVASRYAVDPARIYIGGFSGGSRAALRVALAYPDLFHGAILNAGSDPIGDADNPLPPRDLLDQMQRRTRLVYVTGDQDAAALRLDTASTASLRGWCVFDIVEQRLLHTGHDIANASALFHALDALARPRAIDEGKIAACRSGIEGEMGQKLQEVEALIARGKRDEARDVLRRIDQRYGGLAAPKTLELAKTLGEN